LFARCSYCAFSDMPVTESSSDNLPTNYLILTKDRSSETALLYIHDHLTNATGSQKCPVFAFLTTLLPLTLSTIRSSCFGIHGRVLKWFKSYLIISLCVSKWQKFLFLIYHLLLCSQGSVLGPILFIMYITLLPAYNDRAGSAVCQGQFLNDGVWPRRSCWQSAEYGWPRHRTVPGVSFPATPTQARAVIANYGISKDARARIRKQPSGLLQQPALRRQW